MANETDCSTLAEEPSAVKAVKILSYSLVLIVSLLGNSAIITITARNKGTHTSVNYLIANMAASDLLISILAVPRKICEILLGPGTWLIDGITGLILCKLVSFFNDISTAVSIQSLVVISIERYRAIVYPLYRPAIVTPKRCKVIIPVIWLLSMALHGIYFYAVRLESYNNTTMCVPNWAPAFDHRKALEQYLTVVSVLVILVPFSIITFAYSRIIWSLRKEESTRRSNSASSRTVSRLRQAENIKVFKNICAIVVAFACCVLPIYIFTTLFHFLWKWHPPCNMYKFGFFAHFALYSNSAISPVICLVCFDRYRQGLKYILKQLYFWHKDNAGIILNHEEVELNQLQAAL